MKTGFIMGIFVACLAWGVLPAGALPAPDEASDPQPAEGDLALPMPNGMRMVFRPVYLGVGGDPFAAREFKVGDRAGGGFKEYPTVVVLGGSFKGATPTGDDWCFYLGKYEVSEAQYAAVMEAGSTNRGALPATGITWFQAQEFIHKYNLWLNENARDALPRQEDMRGYLRLPTEMEWEFAARGGAAVGSDIFDRKHPYTRELTRYEWFSGPSSSHDKIKKIGKLSPNPIGLHDMLGNVSEMSESLYRVEYYQGRPGGVVARGGSFRTPESKIRSSLRTESPLFTADLKPFKQDELGFRLLIASPVYSSREAGQRLEVAWESYRLTRPTPTTAAASISPTSAKTAIQLSDAMKSLERLEGALKGNAAVPPDALDQLGLLKASFGDMQSLIQKAEHDSAAAWARIGSFTAWFLARELRKVADSEALIASAEASGDADEVELFKERHEKLLANIRDAAAQYGLVMQELGKIDPAVAKKGFERYEQHLIAMKVAEQIKINRLVLKQFEEYTLEKRLNMENWQKELVQK